MYRHGIKRLLHPSPPVAPVVEAQQGNAAQRGLEGKLSRWLPRAVACPGLQSPAASASFSCSWHSNLPVLLMAALFLLPLSLSCFCHQECCRSSSCCRCSCGGPCCLWSPVMLHTPFLCCRGEAPPVCGVAQGQMSCDVIICMVCCVLVGPVSHLKSLNRFWLRREQLQLAPSVCNSKN